MKANSEKKIPGQEKVIHPLKRTGQWMRRIGIYSLILVCVLVSCENVQDVVMQPLTTDETHGAGESGRKLGT
ncbi:hypothetical protein HYR99_32220 [Candidatus Poribacteria bacterium]|nr:hypothetical protein [Candidatus Poribacteria bacterium]